MSSDSASRRPSGAFPQTVLTAKNAREALAKAAPARFVSLQACAGLETEIYQPQGVDRQQPHSRDELYVVLSGSGSFQLAEETFSFTQGDAIYVPAWVEHRFVDFSEDFATWVFFLGPERERSA